YNKAVPAAMASLTGKHVVVPSEAGLMGAFGVALEMERRMDQGLLKSQEYDLQELIAREVEYGEPFKCGGGKDCDRGCEISRIKIKGKVYPFGGTCNRYDNLVHNRKVKTEDLNLVIKREQRVFRDLTPATPADPADSAAPADTRPTVGMNRSFLINTYFPFFNAFFAELGFRLTIPSKEDPKGMDQQGAAFCYPVEIAHNYAAALLAEKPDYIFMPHLRGLDTGEPDMTSCTCVLVQGEPYYLRTAFLALANDDKVVSQAIDFSNGNTADIKAFRELAQKLGVDPTKVAAALEVADTAQKTFTEDIREIGRQGLAAIEADPEKFGTVVFGRPYNAFASVANKGIPAKFASRGITVIPFDMLPYWEEQLADDENMYWATGQIILKGARFVKRHPQLYATYITNFSCGPDSFLISFFRDIMGRKPSLTLELDSHTADAGLETRIEAFLDITRYHSEVGKNKQLAKVQEQPFRAAVLEDKKGVTGVRTSDNRWLPLTDPNVRVLVPAMSRYATPLLAAAFRRVGIRAEALPPADEEALKLGRGHSSCKECLPLQTTLGSLLKRIKTRKADEVLVYYMPGADGPCRFGQYYVFTGR
ncbi:MAG: activase, partial [Candidatus Electrothrix sp. GM3_4]|nr:activase [Candidatus Electrothrix sp. GM3_4]